MKQYILLMLLLMISSLLWSQNPPTSPCTDTVGISTDPRPGKAFNNERTGTAFHNTFNWMDSVYSPVNFAAGVFQTINDFNSPFFNNSFFLNYLANQTNSDFYPEDGWELIHWGFGYKVDGSLDSYDRELPVFLLYNRYSGMLHVFGATYLVGYDVYGLELRLTLPSDRTGYKVNGLFGMFEGETAQVLDEQTSIMFIRANSKHSNQYKKFAHAAFPMAYDPCVCQDWSSIQVWFHAVDTSKINLVGKTLGTITPIEDYPLSGTGPEFHPDWLNSVSTDGANNVIAGLEVHRYANELYQESINDMNAKGKTDIADQLAIAKIALELGVDLLGLIPIPGSGAPAAIKDAVKIIDKISKGMKIAGKGVSLSQSILKLKKEDDPAEPSLSIPALLRAETRMIGYMVDADDQLASEFAVPGSKDSWTLPEANYPNQPYYPLYNEELGVFALLETPVIERVSTLVNSTDGICTNSQQITDLKYVTTEKRSYRLKNPIKYAVNRATRFNMEASNISAAIVIRNSRPATYDPTHQVVPSLGNLEEGADDFLYVSPFLPLECLEELTLYLDQIHTACGNPTYSPGTDTIFLRFVNTYITQKNSTNGFPLVSQQVLTFPVVIEDVSSLPISPKVPFDLVLAGGEITGDIGAWRSVKVSGDIFSNSSVHITAGTSLDVIPGVTIDPSITLEMGETPRSINCSSPNLPLSPNELLTYCQSNTYKANQPSRLGRQIMDNFAQRDSLKRALVSNIPLTAQPNPFSDELTLSYELPAEAQVQMQLVDMMGRPVRQILPSSHRKAGQHEMQVNLSDLASGMYTVILQVGEMRQTVKVIKR